MTITKVSREGGLSRNIISSVDEMAETILRVARKLECPAIKVFDALVSGQTVYCGLDSYTVDPRDLVIGLAEEVAVEWQGASA